MKAVERYQPQSDPPDVITIGFLSFLALVVSFIALFRTGVIDREVAQAVQAELSKPGKRNAELTFKRHEAALLECIQRVEKLEGEKR